MLEYMNQANPHVDPAGFAYSKRMASCILSMIFNHLTKLPIRDVRLPPIVDDFIEPFAGRQCYMVFDLFWGFDARKVHPASRDLTASLTPLGLLCLTSLPMGFTNSYSLDPRPNLRLSA